VVDYGIILKYYEKYPRVSIFVRDGEIHDGHTVDIFSDGKFNRSFKMEIGSLNKLDECLNIEMKEIYG